MMLREITITLLILAVCTTSLYSQNIKNKEDMQKVFETFALSTQDLDQSVKGFEAIVHMPIYPFAEILENQNISDKEDYICFTQEIFLSDETAVRINYTMFKETGDALKAAIFLSSDSAWIAHISSVRDKAKIGLKKCDFACFYRESEHFSTRFSYDNICLLVGINSKSMSENEMQHECYKYAKIIIERIKKMNDAKH